MSEWVSEWVRLCKVLSFYAITPTSSSKWVSEWVRLYKFPSSQSVPAGATNSRMMQNIPHNQTKYSIFSKESKNTPFICINIQYVKIILYTVKVSRDSISRFSRLKLIFMYFHMFPAYPLCAYLFVNLHIHICFLPFSPEKVKRA